MVKNFEDIFIRFGTTHERDGRTDGQTPDDSKDRAYASHRAVKKLNFIEITLPVQLLHKYKYSVFWFILQKQFILVFMHYTKIMRLSYSWISCTAVSLLQWNDWVISWWRQLWNAYIICHLNSVIFYTTWHCNIDELKHRHLEQYSSEHHRQRHWPVANTDVRHKQVNKSICMHVHCACVKAKGRHFEHLLWSSPTTGSFHGHLHQKWFFLELPVLTLFRWRQHNFTVFVQTGSVET